MKPTFFDGHGYCLAFYGNELAQVSDRSGMFNMTGEKIAFPPPYNNVAAKVAKIKEHINYKL